MPAKISGGFEPRQFFFEELDEKHGFYVEGEEPTMISFRKATPIDESKRAALIGGDKIVYRQGDDGEMVGEMVINLGEIEYATVWAVLEGSNITNSKGDKVLFKGMSYERFKKAVGSLPKDYLEAFYEKALEVNPQWKQGNENF